MGDIINLGEFRPHAEAPCAELSFKSDYDKRRIETVRDHIENMLEDVTRKEDLPLTVAMSAGRFAAMRMFQLQGRAETLAFIDQCITTAELCADLVRQLDEDV
jgi:hypothetical protein